MSVPHFITLWRYCILLEIKVYGNFASSKSIGTIFPTAFAHFMSLFHILVILEMFQTFALFVIFVELPWWLRWLRICLNAGDLNSIPGLGRSSGEGNGHPLQYSCLENSMERQAWWAAVHGITKSWTQQWLQHSLALYLLWVPVISNLWCCCYKKKIWLTQGSVDD